MTMHDDIETLADLYAAGGLEGAERGAVDAHASACAPCASVLRDAGAFATWARGAVSPDAPPAGLEDRIVARLWKRPARRSRPRLRLALKLIGGLAAAALLGFAGWYHSMRQLPVLEGIAASPFDRSRDTTVYEFSSRQIRNAEIGGKIEQTTMPDTGNSAKDLRLVEPNRGIDFADVRLQKLEADATTYVRQLEVQLAQMQELAGKVEESRSRLGPAQFTLDEGPKTLAQERGLSFDLEPQVSTLAAKYGGPDVPEPEPELLQAQAKIVRTAVIHVEIESYDAAYPKIADLMKTHKGYVSGTGTDKLANGKIRAKLILRVPPEGFDAVLDGLQKLGTLHSQTVSSEDLTKEYVDLEARRASKEAFLERLKKLMAEARGSAKELLEIEVQMGATIEELEKIKGLLKHHDQRIAYSTIELTLVERDLGQPHEIVQSLQSTIGLTSRNVDAASAQAQKAVVDAGGQVADSKLTRQNDGTAQAAIKARVDAAKFPGLRESLRTLGHVDADTLNETKSARGGTGEARPDAPLRRELAVIDLTISTPPVVFVREAQVHVETPDVEGRYAAARKAVEAAGRIAGGALTGGTEGANASVVAHVDADRAAALIDAFKALGTVKSAQSQHSNAVDPSKLVTERAKIELVLSSPPTLLPEDRGLGRTVRDSIGGFVWSIEKVFVGIALAAPWGALGVLGWWLWRRRRPKPVS
jgi:hypothetical protein